MTAQITRELADGYRIPLLGLGVWQIPDGRECVNAVRWALEAGYRHIDTAQDYENEASVGRALEESGIGRDEVFITTKFQPDKDFQPDMDPAAALERSLERLRTDHVDLYLVHFPQDGPTWAWAGMERSQELGLTRSIGVSNFSVEALRLVGAQASRQPVINQVQFNPFALRSGLLEACDRLGIVLEAYSPLGTGRHLGDEVVKDVARRRARTPAQVLLRWCVQRRIPVLPKSARRERIEENARIFDFELSQAEMAMLDGLDRTGGATVAREDPFWT